MTTPTDTLGELLRLVDDYASACAFQSDKAPALQAKVRAALTAALSAHPARASQGELSDEQIIAIRRRTDDPSFKQWGDSLAFARAVIAADRAARPESVDARRLDAMQANPRWHLDCEVLKFGKPGKWRVWQLRGNQMHSTSVKTLGEGDTPHEAIDAAMQGDAAIAKGAES